jgi:hypothetical protein
MASDVLETKAAKWGKRMIEVRVRFWTDCIAEGKGQIRPRHAWGGGVILIDRNESHGISPKSPVPFQIAGGNSSEDREGAH